MEPVTIVGAGGIGCALGHALCAAGVDVTFVDASADKVAWGRTHGIGIDGHPSHPARFEHFPVWSPSTSLVLLCTKCYDNAHVLERLPAEVSVLPVQNGFDAALQARPDCLEGIASFVSECHPGQTQTRITRAGKLHLGWRRRPTSSEEETKASRRLRDLADTLKRHGQFRVEVVTDILPFKYTKLMYNAAISPLAAAAGVDNGQLLALPLARGLFFQLLEENYTILRSAGVELGKVGPFHPSTVSGILSRRWLANTLSWAFYPTLRKTYCSMSGDLPAGRTEIDYYNRHLIDLAGDRPCPLNRRVYALVKRMEQEKVRPDVSVLAELVT